MHFVNGFNQLFADSKDEVVRAKYKEVKQFLKSKKEDEPDNKDVLTLKGLIRRGEARIACEYNGVPKQKIHFLDLPFYETGRIIKRPLSKDDVQIIEGLEGDETIIVEGQSKMNDGDKVLIVE
jgi:glucosamine-6-phosphate deaminase